MGHKKQINIQEKYKKHMLHNVTAIIRNIVSFGAAHVYTFFDFLVTQ